MIKPSQNRTSTIGGVSSLFHSFVAAESSVLRTNFCVKKPAQRQSATYTLYEYNQLHQPPGSFLAFYKNWTATFCTLGMGLVATNALGNVQQVNEAIPRPKRLRTTQPFFLLAAPIQPKQHFSCITKHQ
jgi:hypothetical protein